MSLPGFAFLLAVVIFACFPDVLLGRTSFYSRDYGVIGLPVVEHFKLSFIAREMPLWNPLSNCGVPFFAQWGAMCSYPLSLIYLLLPLPWSLSFFCFLHLWIGGIGMYLLARRWTGNSVAGAVGGAGYVFNGIMFASFIWPNYFVALGWMPFVVLLAERASREGGRWIAVAALVAALQLGSGVPEIVLMTWLIAGVVLLCDFSEAAGSGGRMFVRVVVVVALAGTLMAVQLLPFFDLLMHSQRDASFSTSKWSLPVWAAANFIVPLLNSFETPGGQFFQYGQGFLSSVYLGLPLVALAVLGLFRYSILRTWALLFLAMFAVILAFGDQTPVFPALRKAMPGLGFARYPVKFLFIPAFVVPLLAAMGVRSLHVEPRGTRRGLAWITILMLLAVGALVYAAREQWLTDMSSWPANFQKNTAMSWNDAAMNAAVRAVILVAIVIALLGSLHHGFIGGVLGITVIALLAVDAKIHVPRQNPTLPVAELRGNAWPESAGPKPKHGEGRVFISRRAEEVLLDLTGTNAVEVWNQKRRAEWSNLNLLDQVPKVNGSATLQIRDQARFQSALYGLSNAPSEAILDFLGVTRVKTAEKLDEWSRRTNAMPLVTGGQSVIFADGGDARKLVLAPHFDARRMVVLPKEAQPTFRTTNGTQVTVLKSNISAHRIEAEVEAKDAGIVVVAQSFYPAWQATIDGTAATPLLANSAFIAIPVPAGKHQVMLIYRDKSFALGGKISAGGLLLCFALFFVRGSVVKV